MGLINTQFTVFALILPFLLNVCYTSAKKHHHSDSGDIMEPMMMSRSSEPMQPLNKSSMSAMMGDGVYPSRGFIRKCHNTLTRNRVNQNPESEECLLFCGYMDIGMLNHNADVLKSYLTYRIPERNYKRSMDSIGRCLQKKGASRMVCTKATKNAWCVCQHVAKCEIVWELEDVV
ncbi:uncharacterized protein LOC135850049 [Planococcus citri]|uniref:uncharacterized protein LOC135850049 n=1 Tax=Planococcus citri TaxID=170843 RepID=UPI0031F7E19F